MSALNRLCRAICIHGPLAVQIWRGPIRADFNLAQIDADDHSTTCSYSTANVIYEGDPGWD
jgi:hypothetical protein